MVQLQTNRNPPSTKIRIPKILINFLDREIKQMPENRRLSLVMFEPMEIEDWCQFWIPIIHPDITPPTPEDKRRPKGYLTACKTTIAALTQSSESSVENWLYGYYECPYVVKMYLRSVHLLWLMRRQFRFPINFPDY